MHACHAMLSKTSFSLFSGVLSILVLLQFRMLIILPSQSNWEDNTADYRVDIRRGETARRLLAFRAPPNQAGLSTSQLANRLLRGAIVRTDDWLNHGNWIGWLNAPGKGLHGVIISYAPSLISTDHVIAVSS